MKTYALVFILLSVVLISGCTQAEPQELKELRVRGHPEIYVFETDLRDALFVPSNNETSIREQFLRADQAIVVFDGSHEGDNGLFRVALINIGKVPIFFANEGKPFGFDYYFYEGDVWFDGSGRQIQKPVLDKPTLWLLGPNTGANETSIMVQDNIITLQATNLLEFRRAADKFVLIIFGIDEISDVLP